MGELVKKAKGTFMENERDFIVSMLQDMPHEDVISILSNNDLMDIDKIAQNAIYDADDYTIKQIYSYLRDEY